MAEERDHRMERRGKPIVQNISYTEDKEVKKEYYEDAPIEKPRTFSILESTNEAIRTSMQTDLNSMSFCIMSYNGPSSLTPEETLLQMHPYGKVPIDF